MIKSILSLAAITVVSLSFTGCGSSSDNSSGVDAASTDVTVERGPVYSATVKDASGKIAQQKDGQNVYTFVGTPTYPITASGGWIDVDGDGEMTTNDIELNIEMKSYSDVLTPVTTYIADSDATKREEKLQALLTLVNSSSDENVTSEELLKVASQASQKAQMAINAVYAEMIESNSTDISTDDVLGRINEFENLNMAENLSAQDRAEMYEEYIINSSDLATQFTNKKLNSNDITKYNMPVLNISSISKDSKSIVIVNNFPLEAFAQLQTSLNGYEGLTYYRASNNSTTCSSDFSGYSYCNELDLDSYGYSSYYSSDTISIIGTYDIPNYVEDTSNAGINDIVGRTFYSIDTEYLEEWGEAYYSKIIFTSLVPMEDSGSQEYELVNGEWVLDSYDYEDDEEIFSIEGDKLKVVSTYTDEGEVYTDTMYVSIAEKTSSYWTIKFEISGDFSGVMYQKWYLSPTDEMLNPSLLTSTNKAPAKTAARVNKIKRKIFGMLVK